MKNAKLFKERVKSMLTERQCSMSQLARSIGVAPSTISRWLSEDDERDPGLPQIHAMARALDVCVPWLTGVSDERREYEVDEHYERLYSNVSNMRAVDDDAQAVKLGMYYSKLSSKSQQALYDMCVALYDAEMDKKKEVS